MFDIITGTQPPVHIARSEAERIEILTSQLVHKHQVDPSAVRVVKAPLRICPLGAHIDHQLGLVTGITIDQSLLMAFVPTTDGSVHIESEDFFNKAEAFDGLLSMLPKSEPSEDGITRTLFKVIFDIGSFQFGEPSVEYPRLQLIKVMVGKCPCNSGNPR